MKIRMAVLLVGVATGAWAVGAYGSPSGASTLPTAGTFVLEPTGNVDVACPNKLTRTTQVGFWAIHCANTTTTTSTSTP